MSCCCTCTTTTPRPFRYLALVQAGDLPIFICDSQGPVSPERITYSLYFVHPSGELQLMGPARRTPQRGRVGEFYAVGREGELHQPGNWVIRWQFQLSATGAEQTQDWGFSVLDAVLAVDPHDTTPRVRKYGWV